MQVPLFHMFSKNRKLCKNKHQQTFLVIFGFRKIPFFIVLQDIRSSISVRGLKDQLFLLKVILASIF